MILVYIKLTYFHIDCRDSAKALYAVRIHSKHWLCIFNAKDITVNLINPMQKIYMVEPSSSVRWVNQGADNQDINYWARVAGQVWFAGMVWAIKVEEYRDMQTLFLRDLHRVWQILLRIWLFHPDHGIWHISSFLLVNSDLLMLINQKMDLHIVVDRNDNFRCDRSFNSDRLPQSYWIYTSCSWRKWSEMTREDSEKPYLIDNFK